MVVAVLDPDGGPERAVHDPYGATLRIRGTATRSSAAALAEWDTYTRPIRLTEGGSGAARLRELGSKAVDVGNARRILSTGIATALVIDWRTGRRGQQAHLRSVGW